MNPHYKHPNYVEVRRSGKFVSSIRSLVDSAVGWIALNARSFSYLLPDTLEIALYFGLAVYFAFQLAHAQA